MKIRKIDRRIERHILIGMITNTNYLAFVSTKITKHDLENQYARTIAGWCLSYYEKYQKAPGKHIQELYEYNDKKGNVSDDEVDLIEKLLKDISEQYSEVDPESENVDFLLDKTEEYLKRNQIQKTIILAQNKIEEGDIKEAETALLEMKPVQITARDGIDPLADLQKIKMAFESNLNPLFKLDGAIGNLLNEHLTRDSFVCFQAGEKVGKTWLLYYLCICALQAGLKVALFQIGDLTESQSIVRLGVSLCRKSNKKKYCGQFSKPLKFIASRGGDVKRCKTCPIGYDVEMEDINIDHPLTPEEAFETYTKFCEIFDAKNNFRLFTRPSDTITFSDIDAELDRLEKQEGFVADVVVVDFMDLAKCEEKGDDRTMTNKIWKRAKSMNNKRHNLLLSATQADAASYTGDLQTKQNYSEDKRKYGHVNAMIGVAQTDKEKKDGIVKMNLLVAREGEFSTSSACYVLQSLRTGEPVVDSLFCENMEQEQHSRREVKTSSKGDRYQRNKVQPRRNGGK